MQQFKLKAVRLAVLFSITSLSFGAIAAEEAGVADQKTETTLPEVKVQAVTPNEIRYKPKRASTATKTDADIMEVPQVVNVVPAQVLIDQQARSLDDALKNVSGITMGNNFGHTADSLFIRGFGGGFFGASSGILRDGLRSQTSRNFSITTERVEVLKGPSSLLYGIQEPGGVVNVISKKPLPEARTEISLTANSFGGGSGYFDVSMPLSEEAGFRLLGEKEGSDYWRNFGQTKRTLLAPSFAWAGDKLKVNLNYEYLDFEVPFDRGTVFLNGKPLDVPYSRRFGERWEKMDGISQFAQGQVEYELAPALKLRSSVAWSNEINSDRRAMVASLSPTGAVTRTAQGVDDRERDNLYASIDVLGKFTLASTKHEVLAGFDFEKLDAQDPSFFRQSTVAGFNVFDPVYGVLQEPGSITAATTFAWQKTNTDIENKSIFLQDTIHFGEQWIALLGGRYQESEQFASSRNLRLANPPKVITNDSKHDVFLPRVGLVYRLQPWVSIYGNYSESFKPNISVDGATQGPFDPEEGVIYEAGAKFDLSNGISATVALFNITKENVLVNEGGVSRTAGEARSRGLEIDAAGKLTDHWDVIGAYAYTDTEVLKDLATTEGNRLQNSPRNQASLYLNYRTGSPSAGGQWTFGGGARYVGERPVDIQNRFSLDSYTIADAYAAYQWQAWGRLATVRLNVKNLFDKEHYTGAISGVITNTGGGSIFMGEPRQVLLQSSIEF
ncbi:MAG: TonB-dependent siderophore receptor [Methylotenera sp.]|nr:TonB-dependent siderophore receptor [Methylotenera sp.]